MVAYFIVDVLSIPVGNNEVLNFPRNFSVNLIFSSSTDYAHNFSHHLSKHCANFNCINLCTSIYLYSSVLGCGSHHCVSGSRHVEGMCHLLHVQV
jgi:hypothetical protein